MRAPRTRSASSPNTAPASSTPSAASAAGSISQRQRLWELGPAGEAWLTELVHRRPTQWRRDVEECFALLQDHGPAPLRDAFGWGVRHGVIGAEYVRTRLATLPPAAEVGS